MLKRQYHEPIRDRDKNWALESQREVLNVYAPSDRLPLGIAAVVVIFILSHFVEQPARREV
jgi:hypothetical protein